MERSSQHHHTIAAHAGQRKDSNVSGSHASNAPASSGSNKKWSFGRLFRRKKDVASDSSSEEDRKAGFVPHQQRQSTRGAASVGGSSANLKSKASKANKLSRSGKLNDTSFDHIAVNPQMTGGAPTAPPHPPPPAHVDHEFFLPVETISPSEVYYQNQQQYLQHGAQPGGYTRSSNSLDRRAARAALKTRSAQRLPNEAALGAHSSSEEELISLNSSTFSKYRSDESIHSGGQGIVGNGQSRRSRAARNERYYKRLSRDGEPSNGQVPVMYAPQPTQRWKTQPVPLSIYNPAAQVAAPPPPTLATPRLRNTGSLQHVAPYVQWGQLQQQPKNLQNTVNDSKRSISYDSHIHLQNINGRQQTKPLPPPPPPRDPLRRVNVIGQMQNGSSGDLRPISYAFDQSGIPTVPTTSQRLGGRCVSDDKIWSGPAGPHYQSMHSLNMSTSNGPQPPSTPHHRRFITRAERDAQPGKKSLPNGIEFHYVADATPRSRKPIHMMEPQLDTGGKEPSVTGILRTTKSGIPASTSTSAKQMHVNDFWKRMDAGAQRRGREGERAYVAEGSAKPRSISSSRVGEIRAYPIPVYSEVQKPNKKPVQASPQPGVDEVDNIVCGSLHIKSNPDASNANFVEIRNKDYNKSSSMPNHYQRRSGEIPNTPNKYDEYVAEKREQHHKPIFTPPTPPQRKLSIPPSHVADLPIYFPRKKPANLEEAINELEAIYKSLGLTEEPEKVEKAEKAEKKERIPTPSEFEKYALAHAHEYDEEDSPSGEPDPILDDVAYRNMQLANLQHKTVEKQPPFGIPVGPVVAAPQNDYLHVTPIVEPPLKLVHKTPDIVKDDLAVRALRKDPPGPKDKFMYPYSSFQKKNRATRTQSANIYNLIHRDAAKPSGGDLHSYLELTRSLERAGSMSDLHKDDGERTADVPATLALLRNLKEQEQQQEQHHVAAKKVAIPFRHPSQGGAICALPEKLPTSTVPHKEEVHKAPVPLPRKSLTPEPTAANAQMEEALNKIAMDAQEKSVKLTKELQELRKEALITAAARPKPPSAEEEKLEKDLQEIEAVSEAAKRCGKMLLDTLPDANESQMLAKPRKLHKEGKLIEAIDQVSEAANAVCEKILKDIVTTEPPVVVQEAVQVKNRQTPTDALVMPNLIKKLDPIQSEKIEAIAKRCMRQLSALADDNPDYDNLNQELNQQLQPKAVTAKATVVACNAEHIKLESAPKVDNLISTVAEVDPVHPAQNANIEEIDQIMQECEEQMRAEVGKSTQTAARPVVLSERTLAATRQLSAAPCIISSSGDDHTTAPSISSYSNSNNSSGSHNVVGVVKTGASTTASSFSSSSDCLAKSSSPSASGRRQSSSITSFNPYSSSDYIKSPSSEYHAPSTDPIKTFSTTSYEVPSSTSVGATTNISATTNSTFSYSPSPPLNLTPVSEHAATADVPSARPSSRASSTRQSQERARTRSFSSPSQYNSSEELAMIFGIDEQPRRHRAHERQRANEMQQQQQHQSAKNVSGKGEFVKKSSVHVPSQAASYSHATVVHATTTTITTMLDTATTTSTTTTTTIFTTANASQLLNTNPNTAAIGRANEILQIEESNKSEPLNVIVVADENVKIDVDVDVDIEDTNTTNPSTTKCNTTTRSPSSITTVNPTTITLNTNNTKNSTTSPSPNSYKLESIPETQIDETSECSSLKLSSNFNKIYASKISILVDGLRAKSTKDVGLISSTHCDSSSTSCDEETSSNPDSGNVSLADYPLILTQSNNAYLQLESACNSRFEVRKENMNFVSEISIDRDNDKTRDEDKCVIQAKTEDFPPPPTEEELLVSLNGVNSLMETKKKTKPELAGKILAVKSARLKNIGEYEASNKDQDHVPETEDDFIHQNLKSDDFKESAMKQFAPRDNEDEIAVREHDFEHDLSSEDNDKGENDEEHSLEECEISEQSCDYQDEKESSLDEKFPSENSSGQRNPQRHNFVEVKAENMGSEKAIEGSVANTVETELVQRRSVDLLEDEQLIELAHLVRGSNDSRKNSLTSTDGADSKNSSAEEFNYRSSARICTELDHLRFAFAELLEKNLTDLDELPRIEEEEDVETVNNRAAEAQDLEHELSEPNSDTHETPRRKQSIVYETPPLKLNICDVKITFSPTDQLSSQSSTQEMLTQISQGAAEVERLNEAPHLTPRQELVQEEDKLSELATTASALLPWRRRTDNELDDGGDGDDKPSTSAAANQRRALSIFGELRPSGAAVAAGTTSLTTLEHVLLACSLGVITPTDLYTLCLLIIGMITIIAIVLF